MTLKLFLRSLEQVRKALVQLFSEPVSQCKGFYVAVDCSSGVAQADMTEMGV